MADLLVIFGPPAVGKMTVGRAVAARTDYRLFHNHAPIEPLLDVFDFGTPSFARLLASWRQLVVDEAVASGTDLLLTFVWGLELSEDLALMQDYAGPFLASGGRVRFVELVADLSTRLGRNATEGRLDAKPSKRDRAWSDDNVRSFEVHEISTRPGRRTLAHELLGVHPWLRLDNTELPADAAADRIVAWLAAEVG